MDFLSFAVWLLLIPILILLLILLSDGDLTLMLMEKFGRSVGSLKDHIIWINGASSGIGEYLAYELAANGAKIILSARRLPELERVKKQCLVIGRKAGLHENDIYILPMDVTKMKSHQESFDKILQHFGRLDMLVNNAGRSQRAHWDKIELEVDHDLFEGNVFGLVHLTRTVLPHFLANHKGHVVVTSSVCGKIQPPFSATYNATKHALHGYFETLRSEFYSKGVRVTMLCPGPVFSELLQACATETHGEKLGKDMLPTDRRLTTERCAHLSAVAIANELDEAWMALNPVLILLYAGQYFPTFLRRFMSYFGVKQAMKLRDSRADTVPVGETGKNK